MARQNVPFLSFNRGLLSPKALGRVDLDRTRLSAEVFTNFLAKTQGALTIRPGTKWLGSSLNDSGAEFLEFVASTDDVALVELTNAKARVWLGDDAHELALLSRPKVDTTVAINDTGWSNTSSGGAFATSAVDALPTMTGATTSGVTVSASSEWTSNNTQAWKAADDTLSTYWEDTGASGSESNSLPSWWKVDFGASNTKAITSYSVRAGPGSILGVNSPPSAWTLEYNDVDTGAGWTTVDTRSAQTGWASSEKRNFTRLDADTGTVEAFRYWRLNYTALSDTTAKRLNVAEHELFTAATAAQVKVQGGKRIFNATSIGALARSEKQVVISDTGTEHSLAIDVERGPVTLRVGSSQRDDDYIRETSIGTGFHNLSFTPTGNFWVTLQHDGQIDRIVRSLSIGDSGTVEITAPWGTNDLENVRYDQSADVVYVDADGVRPSKIERRGTGRSWSVVDYAPDNGPFLAAASSSAKLSVSHFFGNTTMNADRPFFTSDHVGALVRAFHHGQSGQFRLGAEDAATDPIEVTGVSDTGTATATSDRRIVFSVTGTWAGRLVIERSFDGEETGFKPISGNLGAASDTGTFTRTIDDPDDNVKVWYRARIGDTGASGSGYTSGVAVVAVTYGGGGTTGIARVTDFNSNTAVGVEVLSRFSDTGATANWQEGYWSDARSFPTAVALYGGRLSHANGGTLFLSVSDDYENFDDTTVGDKAPIIRTLGAGPVDAIRFLISKLRLLIGTAGSELALVSSSLDEPVTPTNANARSFSTQGSANLRAVHLDTRAVHLQRSKQRLFMIGPSQNAFGDYESFELTLLVPDLLADLGGIVSIAVQRQPDSRIHCVGANGKVAILTYEPQEEVICWTLWQSDTGTNPAVEKVSVLPGLAEDAVFYHVRRTVNGSTKRFLEKWALESECVGDTGLTWLMDCARSYTDTGRNAALVDIAPHLVGESCIVWSDDTGSIAGVDRSPDVDGVQTRYTVDTGGDITLSTAVHHAVAGLAPVQPSWISSKLAYAAEMGSALAQQKRAPQVALCLYKTHVRGIFYGSDTGRMDTLPSIVEGAVVDQDQIFHTLDKIAVPNPSTWKTDPRLVIRGKFPRPATVLAAVPTVVTNEK